MSYMTVEERRRHGRNERERVPRSSQASFAPSPTRPDPVDLLEQQAQNRVPELVPIRYGKMAKSPFAFYRGGALIMASDLAGAEHTDMIVQCCGDAHLSNFGVFGTPERRLVFDVNDFDETLPGPWEWDLKRLAASFAVAGRECQFSGKTRRKITFAAGRAYREAMTAFAADGNLDVWYQHLDVDRFLADLRSKIAPAARKRGAKDVSSARSSDNLKAFSKLTALVDGQRRIISDPPVLAPIEELDPGLEADQRRRTFHYLLQAYGQSLQNDRRRILEQFRLAHLARKVVGVGSVGTRAWILLLVGRDEADPLFLQVKEAQTSVLEPFVARSQFANQGERVVAGQLLMQAASDIFLGWQRVAGFDGEQRDFYIRQLRDWKASARIDRMTPLEMEVYAHLCAWTLARAHARSGDRIAIAAYLGQSRVFDTAIARFAEAYADQNEQDFAALKRAIASGRIEARMDV
jgi:uncharacterized protein (DUF2252 family)